MYFLLLHEIIDHVAGAFRCPECGANTHEDIVQVQHITPVSCELRISCGCGHVATVRAQVAEGAPYVEFPENKISQEDVKAVHKILKKDASISDLFNALDQQR